MATMAPAPVMRQDLSPWAWWHIQLCSICCHPVCAKGKDGTTPLGTLPVLPQNSGSQGALLCLHMGQDTLLLVPCWVSCELCPEGRSGLSLWEPRKNLSFVKIRTKCTKAGWWCLHRAFQLAGKSPCHLGLCTSAELSKTANSKNESTGKLYIDSSLTLENTCLSLSPRQEPAREELVRPGQKTQ